jgi:4,5:9,10-diseco-3-hydroxy-5,9,17-trioxoandrosta-1(10),2-diene-4-oate hydrolase
MRPTTNRKIRRLLGPLGIAWLLTATAGARSTEAPLHVSDSGVGTPVVIIPWLGGGAYGFRAVRTALAEDRLRTIIIEPLGVGNSPRPQTGDYSLDAQTDRVAAVFDRLGLRDVVVLGHSLGGAIALRLACERPELVRAIISVEGGPAETAATPSLRRAMRFSGLIELFVSKGSIRSRVKSQMVESSAEPSWVSDEVVERYAAPATVDAKRAVDVLKAIAGSRERRPLRLRLPSIRCPVELLVGGAPHSGSVPDDQVALLRETVTTFSLTRVPEAGHFIQEECPEAIRSAVERHLSVPREAHTSALAPVEFTTVR